MSNENLKVGDLEPQEQQELCKKMQEAGCKGILANYNVKTAKAKIEEFEKNKQQNGETQETATNENTQEGASETQTQQPQTDGIKENEENAQETQEVVQENANADGKEAPEADGIKEAEEIKDDVVQVQKVSICHICRSAVIDNKCSGCGFSMR